MYMYVCMCMPCACVFVCVNKDAFLGPVVSTIERFHCIFMVHYLANKNFILCVCVCTYIGRPLSTVQLDSTASTILCTLVPPISL